MQARDGRERACSERGAAGEPCAGEHAGPRRSVGAPSRGGVDVRGCAPREHRGGAREYRFTCGAGAPGRGSAETIRVARTSVDHKSSHSPRAQDACQLGGRAAPALTAYL
jgi:hypothetical protein